MFPASFWFIKTPKVGGTTLAEVFGRVAAHHGVTQVGLPNEGDAVTEEQVLEFVNELSPRLGFSYFGIMFHLPWKDLDIGEYLRFTAVRHPMDRALSAMYHRLCLMNTPGPGCLPEYRVSDLAVESVVEYLEGMSKPGDIMPWMSQVDYALDNLEHFDQATADELDFIFVTDRMDESLVAFKILYGLRWEDVVYKPERETFYTRYEEMNAADQRAVKNAMERLPGYAADDEFYRYASDRLDRAISEIDREFPGGVFAKQLECLQRLKDEAGKHCSKTRKLIDVATSLAVEEIRCYDQMIRSLEES